MIENFYSYQELADGTVIAHSGLCREDKGYSFLVAIERHATGSSAVCVVPFYTWPMVIGFSEDEIDLFSRFIHQNENDMYASAKRGNPKNQMSFNPSLK